MGACGFKMKLKGDAIPDEKVDDDLQTSTEDKGLDESHGDSDKDKK